MSLSLSSCYSAAAAAVATATAAVGARRTTLTLTKMRVQDDETRTWCVTPQTRYPSVELTTRDIDLTAVSFTLQRTTGFFSEQPTFGGMQHTYEVCMNTAKMPREFT